MANYLEAIIYHYSYRKVNKTPVKKIFPNFKNKILIGKTGKLFLVYLLHKRRKFQTKHME